MNQNHETEEAVKAAANTVPLPWGLIGVAKDFGVVVVLIWYLWFSQTVSIPNAQREFHEVMVKERDVFRAELATQRSHDEKRNTELLKAIFDLTAEMRRHRFAEHRNWLDVKPGENPCDEAPANRCLILDVAIQQALQELQLAIDRKEAPMRCVFRAAKVLVIARDWKGCDRKIDEACRSP